MSSNETTTTPTPPKTAEPVNKEENSKGLFLGIDFNKPEVLIGAAAISIPLAYFGINILKQFIFKEPVVVPPQPTNRRIPKHTTEELRQMEYQRQLDLANKRRKMTEEEQYLEAMRMNNTIGQTNNNLSRYNVHRNYNPVPITDIDNEIDIIDDNQIIYNNYVQPQFHQPPQPQQQQQQQQQQEYQPIRPQQRPIVYQPPEDSLLINSDEINVYTDNDVDANSIPKEFTNVGNRPEPFENIKPINNEEQEEQRQQQQQDDDIYNIENMEISEEDLKNMETKAFTENNNEYYK